MKYPLHCGEIWIIATLWQLYSSSRSSLIVVIVPLQSPPNWRNPVYIVYIYIYIYIIGCYWFHGIDKELLLYIYIYIYIYTVDSHVAKLGIDIIIQRHFDSFSDYLPRLFNNSYRPFKFPNTKWKILVHADRYGHAKTLLILCPKGPCGCVMPLAAWASISSCVIGLCMNWIYCVYIYIY